MTEKPKSSVANYFDNDRDIAKELDRTGFFILFQTIEFRIALIDNWAEVRGKLLRIIEQRDIDYVKIILDINE